MIEVERRAESWQVHVLVRKVVVYSVVIVGAIVGLLLVSREAASAPPRDAAPAVVGPPAAPLIRTAPGGGLVGPGLVVDGVELDAEQCLTIEPGSSVLTLAAPEASSVWVHAGPQDLVRVDYESATKSESTLIPESHLGHEFAPGRVTVTVTAREADATVRFVALRSLTRLCGLRAE